MRKPPGDDEVRGRPTSFSASERPDPLVRERLLEKWLWSQWSFDAVNEQDYSFFSPICHFIQSYQVPLQGTRADKNWGKIDLVGATPVALPAVLELKQDDAGDTPLRMLVEAVAYGCAVRRAWSDGLFRNEWSAAMQAHGRECAVKETLHEIPVLLLAPAKFWETKIGLPGIRSRGKVKEDAWPPFVELVQQLGRLGFPIHFLQFEIEEHAEATKPRLSKMSSVPIPGLR